MTDLSIAGGLAVALEIAERALSAGGEVRREDIAAMRQRFGSNSKLPDDPAPSTSHVTSSGDGLHVPLHHARSLAAAIMTEQFPQPAASIARTLYHARMLSHAVAPRRTEHRPLVTILIPVFNRAGPLVEAVQSCLDQTWRPIEILVIDDGSTDDPTAGLAQFGDQVRLVRQQNRGVASARNLGVSLARGDFIHFLDSDDLLLPRAIESKMEIYLARPDTELCYGQGEWIDMRTSPPTLHEAKQHVPENPVRSMIVAFPFLLQQVMMPRWRVLAAAPFEEDLRRSSDFRFWQALAYAGVNVASSPEVTTRLRRFHDSLHLTPEQEDDSHAVALLRGLRDLIRHPDSWPFGIDYINILAAQRARYWFEVARSDRVRQAQLEVLAAVSESGRNAGRGDLSALPLYAALRERIGSFARRGAWPAGTSTGTYAILSKAIETAIMNAAPLTDRDLAFWTGELNAAAPSRELRRFFAAVKARNASGAALSLADNLLRRAPRIPRPKHVRRALRLLPFLRHRLTTHIVSRWMRH